ncbi:MAG: hypothetical protein AVDCRST_MAG45-2328, partial [uncultured Solirubrobacterales bacterium]
ERGRADPGAARDPRPLPAAPLRGRIGRLQPDSHRPRVRAPGRAALDDPSRPLHHGAGGAGQHRRRGRRSAFAAAPRGAVPRDGPAGEGDRRAWDGAGRRRGRNARRHRGRAGRQSNRPQRRGRADSGL